MYQSIKKHLDYLMAVCLGFFNLDLETLSNRIVEINQKSNDIVNTAMAEERDLTDEEQTELDKLDADYKAAERQVTHLKRIADQNAKLTQGVGRVTEPAPITAQGNDGQDLQAQSNIVVMGPAKGTAGFKSFGEFAQSVRLANPKMSNPIDPRLLRNAPTTYSTEGVGADGGFAVPPDFRSEILEKVQAEGSLLALVDKLESGSNSVTFPKDNTTPWDSSGGIQAYWEGEAAQLTQSKIALESELFKLNKLTALIPVSEELMEDAPAIDSYLRRKVPEKFDYKITDALLNGTGAGRPTGVLNAGCLVDVDKESGQAADTIQFENIVAMWSRMYAPCWKNAVWHINQDILPQLFTMSFEGTSSSVPAYMPANGLSASPYGTLMGRPVMPSQACQTLGDLGDIVLADWTQYLAIMKTGGIRGDVSIHLYFDYDMVAYRFILRMSGQPWWRNAITPANSSNTVSAFVSLKARA